MFVLLYVVVPYLRGLTCASQYYCIVLNRWFLCVYLCNTGRLIVHARTRGINCMYAVNCVLHAPLWDIPSIL